MAIMRVSIIHLHVIFLFSDTRSACNMYAKEHTGKLVELSGIKIKETHNYGL